jgi:hypothetical protein
VYFSEPRFQHRLFKLKEAEPLETSYGEDLCKTVFGKDEAPQWGDDLRFDWIELPLREI